MAVTVTSANVQDRDALAMLCTYMKRLFPRLYTILADAGYDGRQQYLTLGFGWLLKVMR